MQTNKKLIIECICGGHLLLIEEELLKGEVVYSLNLYSNGVYHPKPKLFHKLKVMWNYIFHNSLWDDQVVLKSSDLNLLKEFIENVKHKHNTSETEGDS